MFLYQIAISTTNIDKSIIKIILFYYAIPFYSSAEHGCLDAPAVLPTRPWVHRARHPRLETEPRAVVDKVILLSHFHVRGFGLHLIFKARVFETRKWPFCCGGGRVWGGGGGGGCFGGARNLKNSGGTWTFVALILWHILVSSEKNSPHTRRDKQTASNGSQSG